MKFSSTFALLILLGIATANAREAMRVDGVPVYGKVHTVERIDLRNAIKQGDGRGGVSKLEVLGPGDIKVYLRPRDRGYILAGRFAGIQADGSRSHFWSFGPFDVYDREGLNIIRGADEVFVFPNLTPSEPYRDNKRMRLLSGEARREIVQLLGNERNWFHGLDDFLMLGREPRNIGLLFRHGKDEVVLFFKYEGRAEGTINGQYVENALQEKQRKQIHNWAQRYAKPELTAK